MPIDNKKLKFVRETAGWVNTRTKIAAKMTPGMGDLMSAMNIAHMRSLYLQDKVNLELHWYHDKDFLYHFEDPETIVERFEYINNFYFKKFVEVEVTHIFNSTDTKLHFNRYDNFIRKRIDVDSKKREKFRFNDWFFRTDIDKTPVDGKVVLWTPVWNAQDPRNFKIPFPKENWDQVKDILSMQGYDIIEIDYRTPISEVFYHIRTAEVCLCYEGMWHYIAKNMAKPMIVLTKDNITNYHTPDALIYKVRKAEDHSLRFFYEFDRRVARAKLFSDFQKRRLKGYFRSEN